MLDVVPIERLVVEVGSEPKVAVVGAGFGGIGMGVALARAGYEDFVILEKADSVGGVWRENTYPGCGCDVPSHLYSYSFAPYRDPRRRYPRRDEIQDYLASVVESHGLTRHLLPNAALESATWLADRARWELRTTAGAILRPEVVVFALGQLHLPSIPDIPGRDTFAGPAFHTARWDHGQSPDGLDVAVIGTGSSAAQLLPHVAARARRVHLYQRTPHWLLPKPAAEFGALSRVALRAPGAHAAYRAALGFGADTVLAPLAHRGWSARPLQWYARGYLRRHVDDRRLRASITPDYPLGTKRVLFDSAYLPALSRGNVHLVTDPIRHIAPEGIETVDGAFRRADLLVYATGFRASEFLAPVTVRGRGGRSLREQWAEGAEAFMGLAVPGFPNAFLIAGPHSFTPAGSNPVMKEHQIAYIVECLRWRDRIGAPAVEVGAVAMARYHDDLRRALARSVWSGPVGSWYKDSEGRVVTPWPGSVRDFARRLRRPPGESFVPVDPTSPNGPDGRQPCPARTPASTRSPRSLST